MKTLHKIDTPGGTPNCYLPHPAATLIGKGRP
jgi:hypothetical protein